MSEELHAQIDALDHTNWRVRAILHGMVASGTLTQLECQLPECYMDNRQFDTQRRGRGHNAKGLVIDHVVPQLSGGTDRPENLRAIHATCNVMRARGWKMSPEARAKLSAAAKARGGWKVAIEKRQPGFNRAQRADDGRAKAKLDETTVREMRQRYASGTTIRTLAVEQGVCYSTARAAVRGLLKYAAIE